MPTDLLLRLDWSNIYPPFRDKTWELAARCRKRGVDYYATSGFRSPEEQMKLWLQGRNAAGAVVDPKKIVTKVKFGLHNVGCAVDFTFDAAPAKGLQPRWQPEDYRVLAEEATALGLEAGFFWASFRDAPHVQVPIGSKNITITMLRGLHAKGGLKAVWGALDRAGLGT